MTPAAWVGRGMRTLYLDAMMPRKNALPANQHEAPEVMMLRMSMQRGARSCRRYGLAVDVHSRGTATIVMLCHLLSKPTAGYGMPPLGDSLNSRSVLPATRTRSTPSTPGARSSSKVTTKASSKRRWAEFVALLLPISVHAAMLEKPRLHVAGFNGRRRSRKL